MIGRVILNLINNAFCAVNEKNASVRSSGQEYEPLVTEGTQKTDGKVIIRVKDNGNGIPQNVLDKIFQPFLLPNQPGREPAWDYP